MRVDRGLARWRLGCVVCVFALLSACASVTSQKSAPTPVALAAQAARETALAQQARWTIQARIAVSGENGGSGDLVWRQDGDNYSFSVRGANGRTLRLSGDATHATLEGVDAQADVGEDPQTLLHDRLGAEVPFRALRRWVLGLRVPGEPAQLQFDANNLPAQIDQQGWSVDYRDWFAERTPALPKAVFATRGKDKVKLIIQSWDFD